MHEFGAAAGGALADVVLFEQWHAVAARCGVDGHADARGAAAHHDHVPDPRASAETGVHLSALHVRVPAASIAFADARQRQSHAGPIILWSRFSVTCSLFPRCQQPTASHPNATLIVVRTTWRTHSACRVPTYGEASSAQAPVRQPR